MRTKKRTDFFHKGFGNSPKFQSILCECGCTRFACCSSKTAGKAKLIFREWVLIRFACSSIKFNFYGKDRIRLDKGNQANRYVSFYEIGGTTYEVETSFSGTETLNNKIIRLMLAEKIKSKGADNSEEARYNNNTHSVLSGGGKEEFE